MTATRTGTGWIITADPTWYPRVLAILQRDFPDAADMAWSTAISENAADQIAKYGSTGRTIGEAAASPPKVINPDGKINPAYIEEQLIGAARACPDCGRPQHYTGTEHGWAHDALIDTWDCADPRKAGDRDAVTDWIAETGIDPITGASA